MKNKSKTTKRNSNIEAANPVPVPRRSIPVKEVNELIDHAVSKVKAARTIYDDRNEILTTIEEQQRAVEYHETCLHNLERNLISLRNQLKETNTAIARELDLDSLR